MTSELDHRHISLIGINHEKTPIAIREKIAISAAQFPDALQLLKGRLPFGVILSTCNRTEIYAVESGGNYIGEAGMGFLQSRINKPDIDLRQHVYAIRNEAAIEHLFRVACGLDSMVIGEFEVLGQVKQSLEMAEKAGMVNLPLRQVFQSAIRTGRRVREETGISKNALSVSSVAIELAEKALGDLKDSKVLVIGAGEAGRLVAKAAKERGAREVVVTSRSLARATTVARILGGTPATLDNLPQELSTANIVVTCAGAPHRVLDVQRIETAMRTRPGMPLVIIDIAVPRNVDPGVGQIGHVFLHNIDDLTGISNRNRGKRESEIKKATEILESEVAKFTFWWQTLETRPVISALMEKAEMIRRAQLDKTLKKLPPLSDEEQHNLEAMTRSIVTKILKEPVSFLKEKPGNGYAEMVSELFQLNGEG